MVQGEQQTGFEPPKAELKLPISAAIIDPAGGATVDAESRTAIIALLNALRAANVIET